MRPVFHQYSHIIPDFSLFQESLYESLPVSLRVNRIKTDPAAVLVQLREKGIHVEEAPGSDDSILIAKDLDHPGRLIQYFLGYVHPQAITSCLASIALSPRGESRVLDMCASPGGKTAHMAQLMENTGIIVANELYKDRHIPLGNTLDRLGVLNTVVTGYQAQEFPLRQSFDFVLADVPCSGEGRFRLSGHGGEYPWTRKKYDMHELQKKIIIRGFDLLDEKGVMLYSTCTYDPDENEGVVDYLLKKRDARLNKINTGIEHEPGVLGWKGQGYDSRLERAARFYPHRTNSVGFFMAAISRSE